VRFQRIGEEIQKLQVSDVGESYLIDRNGRVIYHPDYSLISADYSQRSSVFDLMRGEHEGALIIQEPGKAKQVAGYAIVDVTGWGLVIQEPWADVVAPARISLRPIILALLIGVVLVAVIVSWGAQRVVRPIAALAARSRRVATGDYEVQATPSAIRELRGLESDFNRMVQQIARYQAGLRQYVAAITHTQEEERKRIARDLHDDTTQSLIAIGQRVELAREGCPGTASRTTQDGHPNHR
jgi:methyl-accepting chemotaxis protein